MVTPTNHFIARGKFTLREPLAFVIFATCFSQIVQKKFHHLSAGPLAGTVRHFMVNPALVIALRS